MQVLHLGAELPHLCQQAVPVGGVQCGHGLSVLGVLWAGKHSLSVTQPMAGETMFEQPHTRMSLCSNLLALSVYVCLLHLSFLLLSCFLMCFRNLFNLLSY